jgi:hypothetical protein
LQHEKRTTQKSKFEVIVTTECYKALPKTIIGLPSLGIYVAVPYDQTKREAWTLYMGSQCTSLMMEQSEIRISLMLAFIFKIVSKFPED